VSVLTVSALVRRSSHSPWSLERTMDLEASSTASLGLPRAKYAALLFPKSVKSLGAPATAWQYISTALLYSFFLK